IKPRSAPENGAFVPPSSNRIAGTEPAPMKTSSAVPIASAAARWAAENESITELLPAPATWPAGLFRGFHERRRSGTSFDMTERCSENVRHRTRFCQGMEREWLEVRSAGRAGAGNARLTAAAALALRWRPFVHPLTNFQPNARISTG